MPVEKVASQDDPRFDPESADENALALAVEGDLPEDHADNLAPDLEEVQGTVQRAIERAIQHFEDEIEPALVEATEYYEGEPFGDEMEGRSKVVSTDVRDATLSQLPSLMRIFFGPERAVEFTGKGPEDDGIAAQMTDYINHVIAEDNPGFLVMHDVFEDALVRRLGVVKWWWDEKVNVKAADYSGLGEMELQALTMEPGAEVEILDWGHRIQAGPDGMPAQVPFYDVRVTRREPEGRARFAAVPSEEFMYAPGSRTLETSGVIAHVREVPIDELLQLGIDEDLLEEAAGKRRAKSSEDLEHTRETNESWDLTEDAEESLDASQKPVLFAEAYMRVDGDGDGIGELRLFQCVGPDFEIVNGDGLGEIVDEIPFAIFTPHPKAHTLVGRGNYDLLKDVQRVKSQLLRGTLDSLALALEQKTEVVEGEVNLADLINPEINGLVRVTKPGMMREVGHTFLGPMIEGTIDHFDRVKEDRTGHTRASQGLDADSLQSSTKAAVAATLTAGQQRIEMIARVFAETGMKQLMRGLLRLVVKHQDQARTVRLRGQYVPVDPRHWDATMDVTVNVALGQGTTEEKVQGLAMILSAQKELMQTGSPLVTNVEIRATLGKAVELMGWRNSNLFFRPWGPQEEQALQQQRAQQPPPPDINQMLVQVEQSKLEMEQIKMQTQLQMDAQKLELERLKILLQNDRERDKIAREAALKEHEIEAKNAVQIEDVRLKNQIAADRAAMDADLKRQTAAAKPATGGES